MALEKLAYSAEMHLQSERRGGKVGSRADVVANPSEEKFFECCTNCGILPRPLSGDHFCENSASLLFHSSAGERLQVFHD